MKLSTISGIDPVPEDEGPSDSLVCSSTFLGVEVELEELVFNPDRLDEMLDSAYWKVVEDHSLRNYGAEFVFNGPIRGGSVVSALKELEPFFEDNNIHPDASDRTSVHVHMDVRGFSTHRLLNLLMLWTTFEKVLFHYVGEDRSSSAYCVPMGISNMPSVVGGLSSKHSQVVESILSHSSKYSAINIRPIMDRGSVEVRIHKGEWRAERLTEWVNILLSMHKYSGIMGDAEFLDFPKKLSSNGPIDTLESVFGSLTEALVYPGIHMDIMGGVRIAQVMEMSEDMAEVHETLNFYPNKLVSTDLAITYVGSKKERTGIVETKGMTKGTPLDVFLAGHTTNPSHVWNNSPPPMPTDVEVDEDIEDDLEEWG